NKKKGLECEESFICRESFSYLPHNSLSLSRFCSSPVVTHS
ncbi:unnamed protein product, partial [Brassica oleracea]